MILALTHIRCGHVIAVTNTWRHHRKLTRLRRRLPAPHMWAIRRVTITTAVSGFLQPACPDCDHDGRVGEVTA